MLPSPQCFHVIPTPAFVPAGGSFSDCELWNARCASCCSSYPCLVSLASRRKNALSLTTHSLCTRHCSVHLLHQVRHLNSLPPPRSICYLPVCLAALRSASAAHLPEWISDRSQQRGRPTITAYHSACKPRRAPSLLRLTLCLSCRRTRTPQMPSP
jgi:hypothetical protein